MSLTGSFFRWALLVILTLICVITLYCFVHIPIQVVLPVMLGVGALSGFLQNKIQPTRLPRFDAAGNFFASSAQWFAFLNLYSGKQDKTYSHALSPVLIGHGAAWLAEHSVRVHEASDAMQALVHTPARQVRPKKLEFPVSLLSRNGLALGAPGSGKTQLLILLARAAQARGESVCLIDPKGSAQLYQRLREGALESGRPFFALIPQRAADSVHYDPLRYCLTGTDIASRLISLMPGDHHDVFKHFCWGVVVTLAEACLLLGERPSIALLSVLLPEAGARVLARVDRLLQREHTSFARSTHQALQALVEHDRTHYQKMTVPLRSVFELLCRGSLGQVLGGNATLEHHSTSPALSRTISLDIAIARQQQATIYIGLDALVNPPIAKALAALVLEDIAADAARGLAQSLDRPAQLLLIDEAGEVACEAMLQLLGKGRECGVHTWFAIQTLSDLEWRLGSAAAARVAEGNAGAWFLFRQLDAVSRRESERRLGTLPIARRSASLGTSSMRRMGSHYESDSVSDGFTRETVPRIPEAVFSCLEDMECFAHLPDGSLFHLRLNAHF